MAKKKKLDPDQQKKAYEEYEESEECKFPPISHSLTLKREVPIGGEESGQVET